MAIRSSIRCTQSNVRDRGYQLSGGEWRSLMDLAVEGRIIGLRVDRSFGKVSTDAVTRTRSEARANLSDRQCSAVPQVWVELSSGAALSDGCFPPAGERLLRT
jgi:hypothetical protein